MAELRPLRGGCQCGRNKYIIAVPSDGVNHCQVLFNTEPEHQVPLATPLAAYIRVPLSWYHSTTYALFPDETHSTIRRVYTHPTHTHAKRNFCGYCGTPLSYWSEEPRSEADFINLTIGSLLREDLQDLEDMGLIPESDSEAESTAVDEGQEVAAQTRGDGRSTALKESYGVPWFDGLVEGTRLGKMRKSRGVQASNDGRIRVEWEVTEWDGNNDGDEGDAEMGDASGRATPGKRKRDESDVAAGTQGKA